MTPHPWALSIIKHEAKFGEDTGKKLKISNKTFTKSSGFLQGLRAQDESQKEGKMFHEFACYSH
jgi:hypothetical protein